ncbi:MAG: response regulator transcription factor [Bacteroidales bacterium]|nr:response regulator transcription factor [Bacteroidales bacterium]
MKKKIVIADDHQITLFGLSSLIKKIGEYEVVCEANSGDDVLEFLKSDKTDIVMTDVDMPVMNGLELLKILKKQNKDQIVVVCTMHTNLWTIKQLINSGVNAIVSKHSITEDIETALCNAVKGKEFFSKDIRELIEQNDKNKKELSKFSVLELTKREKQVLKLISQEYTTNEIAEKLFLSQNTIETHRKNLFLKFQVKNVVGLVKKALEFGMLN